LTPAVVAARLHSLRTKDPEMRTVVPGSTSLWGSVWTTFAHDCGADLAESLSPGDVANFVREPAAFCDPSLAAFAGVGPGANG
jgi:hypothetical protein